MKNQALFSSKDKNKQLKCHLLQFLFGALRVNLSVSPASSNLTQFSGSPQRWKERTLFLIKLDTDLVNCIQFCVEF